ncbi:MAG: efflux RND transporter permease subunit [Alistipes sp.]|nr:efflux RND transporter permease subunit [Alistipes sp.]
MGEFFIRRPIFAIALTVAITLAGIISIGGLAIELYPDITPPVVQVSANYVGADAETVNDAVATPLGEQALGVSDMLYMQTTSANDGSMNLQLTFEVGSSPDMDAIFTQNNVAAATPQLPEAVTEQGVVTRKSNTGFLMVYALTSDGRYDDEFLSNYAYINLSNSIEKINGVGKVDIMGAGEYAMRVWIHPERLRYYGIALEDVVEAIKEQSAIYPTGKFGAEPAPTTEHLTYTVILPAAYSTAEEFSSIILSLDQNGNQVRLSDVADVMLGSKSYNVRSTMGDNPSTLIVIYQEPGSNAVEVGSLVREVIGEQQSLLPDGITILPIVDATQNIVDGIKDIVLTLIIALLLVVAIIYLFLQDWRSTLIPIVAIPVSLVGIFSLFPLIGFSLNVISLLALVLATGLVVDDAIVVVEAVQADIQRGLPPAEAAREAMRRVQSPIIATTVVLLAVFIPVSTMDGITGRLVEQFSITIVAAVTLSAFNALTLSPALCALLLRARTPSSNGFFARFNRWFDSATERYTHLSSIITRHTARTALFIGVMCIGIFITWRILPDGFLPDEDEGYLMVMVTTPSASSLTTTMKAMQNVEEQVMKHPEVKYTSSAVGFNMMASISSPSSGVLFVVLKDYSQRKLSAAQLAQLLNEELYAAIPEAECYALIPPSIPGLGVTSGISLQVQDLGGRGTKYLAEQTYRLMDSIKQDKAIANISTSFSATTPQRLLQVNRQQALSEGVAIENIYSTLSTLLGGEYTGNFNRFGRLYQTYVQAAPESRLDEQSLNSYFVKNGRGEMAPLSAFVSVKDTIGVEYITQFNLNQSIALTATPASGTSSGEAMEQIASIAKRVLPSDVGIAWSGLSFQQAKESGGEWKIYLIAIIFAFLALASLYESWSLPLAIMLSVPAAVMGAMMAMVMAHVFNTDYVYNIYVQISLIMLIGLSAKNAILVVEYADRIYRSHPGSSLLAAAISAARERIRPIIMTALAFVLGVMPLIFASGNYSTARNIMGVALVGGMATATVIGVFLYPATYYMIKHLTTHKSKSNNLKANSQ